MSPISEDNKTNFELLLLHSYISIEQKKKLSSTSRGCKKGGLWLTPPGSPESVIEYLTKANLARLVANETQNKLCFPYMKYKPITGNGSNSFYHDFIFHQYKKQSRNTHPNDSYFSRELIEPIVCLCCCDLQTTSNVQWRSFFFVLWLHSVSWGTICFSEWAALQRLFSAHEIQVDFFFAKWC